MDRGRVLNRLAPFVADTLTTLARHHWSGWRLPRTFAGHPVGADVRADLVFTLGLAADAGIVNVDGRAPDDLVMQLLRDVDGAATHTFFSYRIAETLLRHGPFADNPLLARCDGAQRDQVARACDSSDWIELLDSGLLPRNYAAVLARCELARQRLGLVDDERTLALLVERVAELLDTNPRRMLDDSPARTGRYDIYAADVWLFCEPLAPLLGDRWAEGARAALDLVAAVAGPDGAAIPWGRSTGVLGQALTVELAALALALADPTLDLPYGLVAIATKFHGRTSERTGEERAWARRGADATAAVMARFDADGVVDAHRHRAQDRYRGPARRLQLTLDILGKLAWAAATLRTASPVEPATRPDTYLSHDELRAFEDERNAAVWIHRRPGAAFVVPFVGATRSHYLPTPHAPGTYEAPVDRDLPCWTPLVLAATGRFTAGGLPDELAHEPGAVRARWDRFEPSGGALEGDDRKPLDGTRAMSLRADGRALVLDDALTFPRVPDAITVMIPETADRPLTVAFDCPSPHVASRIVVDGIPEWSSAFSGLAAVHQLDVEPADSIRYSIRVTPALRVASTAHGHGYHDALYATLRDRVLDVPSPLGPLGDPRTDLDAIDVFHLHWPEWVAFDDLAAHREIIATLADGGIPVVWTAHNLTPHDRRVETFDPIYQAWADAADAVIHHSRWGEQRMRERYRFRPECIHAVIPHGHFGERWQAAGAPSREEAERALGFPPTGIRLGIVGAPRADKDVRGFLDAFVACGRDDIQVACWSLALDEEAPDDPRIVAASQYRGVSERAYAIRLAACDAIVLPFAADGEMLGTGTVADAIGLGLPALTTGWGYLTEMLGEARVPIGDTVEEMTAALDALDPAELARAAAATAALRERFAWAPLAEQTLALFDRVVLGRPRTPFSGPGPAPGR